MPSELQPMHDAPARRTNPAGTISDVKLGHIVAALGRYRPVLAVVGAVVLLAVVLDGPEIVGGTNRFAANQASTLQSEATTTTTTTPDAAGGGVARPSAGGATASTGTAAAAPSAQGAGAGASSFAYTPPAASTSRSGSGGGSSSSSASLDDSGDPLTITAAAWASRAGGTPLSTTGVPDDSLPVGTRLGQDDKRSFIRLAGDESTLTLVPIDDEDGQRNPGEAVIRMCQITEGGWDEGEGMSFDDAPPYDEEDCVDGIYNDADGSWAFSLFVYPNATDERGFALVPGEDAPLDFQVAFART